MKPLYNEHVVQFYRFRCLLAEAQRRFMAQLHYYTLAMLEQDPDWKPSGHNRK